MKWLRVGIYMGVGALAALVPLLLWSPGAPWEAVLLPVGLGAVIGALCALFNAPLWSAVIGSLLTYFGFVMTLLVYLLFTDDLDYLVPADELKAWAVAFLGALVAGLAPAVLARVLRRSDKDNGRRDAAH